MNVTDNSMRDVRMLSLRFIMLNSSNNPIRDASIVTLSLLSWQFAGLSAEANPSGGNVTQGLGTITSIGNVETINTTTANTFINWNSFNIGVGDTTTFVEPSASSVVWNHIDGSGGMSQIMGSLNANGYVILQNSSGFMVGGSATINAHGLIMTTAGVRPPDLSSGGAWQFNAPPPTIPIINYGKINISGGGSAFLIADNIQNNGTITADQGGKIGLYAGKKVLVSMSPDGRGLSVQVTLPQGSVDNEGNLIADGGTIAAQAQSVNQNGLAQANAVQNINGVVELVASDNLTIGPSSDIEANGDTTSGNPSPGGFVVLQSGNTYSDTPTSVVNVSGQNGGQDGIVEVIGNGTIQSTIGSTFATLVNPSDITLSGNPTDTTSDPANPNFNVADLSNYGQIDLHALDTIELSTLWYLNNPGATGSLTLQAENNLNVDSGAGIDSTTIDPSSYWNINLAAGNDLTYNGDLQTDNGNVNLTAGHNIETGVPWFIGDSAAPSSLSMSAGNNIIVDDDAGIFAGNNWNLNLVAGAGFDPTSSQSKPASGMDGIYVNGDAAIQTQNGDLNLWAANEVQVGINPQNTDVFGQSGIRTLAGGNIEVDTQFGDVNAGSNPMGYIYGNGKSAPIYQVATSDVTQDGSTLGGISTAAGGNVTIHAGGNVTSYLPANGDRNAQYSGGSGAFGPEAGNVTITAGGSVFGNYVLANGVGSITAGKNAGNASGADKLFALSLIDGQWTVNAPNGNIFLQEVRNPNGTFNNVGNQLQAGFHLFDYGADASVTLNAIGVTLTGANLPRPNGAVPIVYAPILNINAGSGGITLNRTVNLFPSAYQTMNLVTVNGGDLSAIPTLAGNPLIELFMSDSSQTKWTTAAIFTDAETVTTLPLNVGSETPVYVNISGDMKNINLVTSKATDLTVAGNMINCGFSGQNLRPGDVTSIKVGGQIFNQSAFSFVNNVLIPALPGDALPPGYLPSWDNIFSVALNPSFDLTVPANIPAAQWFSYVQSHGSLFNLTTVNGQVVGINPGFTYDASTGKLGFGGPMSQTTQLSLDGTITVLKFGKNGVPLTTTDDKGNTVFQTEQVSWAPPQAVDALYNNSQNNPLPTSTELGYRIGGPGEFDVDAGSISLGNSYGILSCGVHEPLGGFSGARYGNLAPLTTDGGASVDVTVSGDLDMLTSTIASLGGGDVNLRSTGGTLDLGSQIANETRDVGFGVFTSGGGNVSVIAQDDVNIDGSRIATYNGGTIYVESLTGNVNVGSGGNTFTGVMFTYVDPATGKASFYDEDVFGSGIVANTLVPPPKGAAKLPPSLTATVPGDITVYTPQGNITADLGGITQQALNGTTTPGPVINLTAGTPASDGSPGFVGNINLGQSGVIGGTVNATANGNITGLIISRQNSNVNAAQNFTGSVLAGGSADVTGGGTVSGIIVGVGGASVSGGSVSAEVLSQNASVNGASSQSTLGGATATAASQSAANQASNESKELASTQTSDDDNKKKKNQPLVQRVTRVTEILPTKS